MPKFTSCHAGSIVITGGGYFGFLDCIITLVVPVSIGSKSLNRCKKAGVKFNDLFL